MRGRFTRRRFLSFSGTVLSSVAAGTPVLAEGALVVVPIVARSSPLEDISVALLERIFLGQPVEDSRGQRVVPFNHAPRTAVRVLFDRRVLEMTPEEVARYWVDQRIRGNTKPPRTVPRTDLLIKVVSQFPGAISYVAVGDLDSSVRALTVGGVGHDSPKYRIR